MYISCSVMSNSLPPWKYIAQAPRSMQFSRQESWSGCHFLLQGIFPTQGSNPGLQHYRRFFTIWAATEARYCFFGNAYRIPKETIICPESTDLNTFANGGLHDIQSYFPPKMFIYRPQGVQALLENHWGLGQTQEIWAYIAKVTLQRVWLQPFNISYDFSTIFNFLEELCSFIKKEKDL